MKVIKQNFRQMRRFKQELTEEECVELLKKELRGVLAVQGDDDYPYAFPMDFWFDEINRKIYFHSAKNGHKIDALNCNDKVSFCIYDEGYKKENEWSLNIKSVIVFGKIRFVEDFDELVEKMRQFGIKYFPPTVNVEDELSKGAKRMECLELTIEHMSGKLVNES